jgi:hypothetical protein
MPRVKITRSRDRAFAGSRQPRSPEALACRIRAAISRSSTPPSLQADRYGDLDRSPGISRKPRAGSRIAEVRPDTVLGREWNGRMQRVSVLADLERQDLSQPVAGCLCDHRYPLERGYRPSRCDAARESWRLATLARDSAKAPDRTPAIIAWLL